MRRDNPKRIQVYDADALTLIKHPTKPARKVDLADISKIEPCEDESRWHETCLIHTVSRTTGKSESYELREAEQLLAHLDKRRTCKVKKCYWQYETANPPASCLSCVLSRVLSEKSGNEYRSKTMHHEDNFEEQTEPDSPTIEPPRRELTGILLLFIGIAAQACQFWQEAAFPRLINSGLHITAGLWGFALPALMMTRGMAMLLNRSDLLRRWWGVFFLFNLMATISHLMVITDTTHATFRQLQSAGGFFGWVVGTPLQCYAGNLLSIALLFCVGLLSLRLIADVPFIYIVDFSREWIIDMLSNLLFEIDHIRNRAVVSRPAYASNLSYSQNASSDTRSDTSSEPSFILKLFRIFHPVHSTIPNVLAATTIYNPRSELVLSLPTTEANSIKSPETIAQSDNNIPSALSMTATSDSIIKPLYTLDQFEPEEIEEDIDMPYHLPPISLLKARPPAISTSSDAERSANIQTIIETLRQFRIETNVIEVATGPTVTRYEVQLGPGVKVSKIVSLADNLAMSLAAIDVRVEAPIPGKAAIGVEVPNATPVTVSLRECLEREEFQNAPSKLTIALGKDVAGHYRYADLVSMPHLLIGGSTNSGKSVCLNGIIASLVYRATPREVKLLMIDPKRVELSLWDGIPHLMHPVVKDVKQAAGIFHSALGEMDRRYDLFAALGTRNIENYNERVEEKAKIPYIVLIVDELADLMMQMGPEIETSICRLAQLARATGIHLVVATQRPSVDIITGVIKANISSRIAFAVASQADSRTILDVAGADRLVGRGDMLYMPIDASKPLRIQGAYLSESETNGLVEYLKSQGRPHYNLALPAPVEKSAAPPAKSDQIDSLNEKKMVEMSIRHVTAIGQASAAMLQRRFEISPSRAAKIMAILEERGVVGPANGTRPRDVLVKSTPLDARYGAAA